MRDIVQSGAFEKDLRKIAKHGKDLTKLYAIVELAQGITLAPRYKPHLLKGNWKPKWDPPHRTRLVAHL